MMPDKDPQQLSLLGIFLPNRVRGGAAHGAASAGWSIGRTLGFRHDRCRESSEICNLRTRPTAQSV